MGDFRDMIQHCTIEELRSIADAHGFRHFESMEKDVLIDWLAERLLDDEYMQYFLMQTEMHEIKVFEQALTETGIRITEELVDSSLLLTTYGIYDITRSYYVIPDDVKLLYHRVMTGIFRERMMKAQKFMLYCGGAAILYGVIPLSELTRIYNHYEHKDKSVEEVHMKLEDVLTRKRSYDCDGEYLIDKLLVQSARTKWMLKHQIDVPYYLPKTKEEFLRYGMVGGRVPDQDTVFVMEFLEDTFEMTEVEARLMYFELQRSLRAGSDDKKLMKLLTAWGCDLSDPVLKASVRKMLHAFSGYIRRWENRGYTDIEMAKM